MSQIECVHQHYHTHSSHLLYKNVEFKRAILPITIYQFLLFGNSIYERMLMKDNIESEFTKYLRLVRHDQQSLGRFCQGLTQDWVGLWCLMPLSTIFQLYRCGDTRLVFSNSKLMKTNIFFTRIIKPICNVINPVE